MSSGFEAGDIVWGKVETHPWWPGQICDEALASLSVRQTKFEGGLFVSFFGDNTYNWLHPKNLLSFECHFHSKSNESKSKAFQEAVQEAIKEVNWREELTFTCRCRNPSIGYEEGAVYPVGQVEKSRREFKPAEMVSFLHKAALGPMNLPRDGHSLRSAARILAYRKIVFAEMDPTYDEAFESADEDPKWASNDHRNALAQGASSGHSRPIKSCGESKRAKVEKAIEGPKVSRRVYGKASVFKNRYKCSQRNGGEALAQGATSTNYLEGDAFPALKGKRKGAPSGHSRPDEACGGSKHAKVEKADGLKVSKRGCGKASVFKNRYKCRQRNEGEAEIVDTEALISKPSKPLTVPLKMSETNIVGKPPLKSINMEKELASPKGAEDDLLDPGAFLLIKVPQPGSLSSSEGAGGSEGGGNALLSTGINQSEDRFENSQRTIPPFAPLPPVPVYRYVYSRQTLSQCGNAMNKKRLESCQTATTTTKASSTAAIARPIFKLLKEIDKHLEDLK